jgi:hypothetical protein
MSHYGVFADVVSSVTSLVSAAGAIRLAFMGRARWRPPEEVVSSGVTKLSGLVTAVGIAVLWVFRAELSMGVLAILAALGVLLATAALMMAIYVNIRHAYYYPAQRTERNRKLGGATLTEEAARICRERGRTPQMLFEDAQSDKDLVWTRPSQALVNIASTLSFIVLIASGSCALAAAGLLVSAQVAISAT